MSTETRRALITALAGAALLPLSGLRAEPARRREQFIYVLRLAPQYHEARNWSERETALINAHLARLTQAVAARQVILAGRTSEAPQKTFGIVIFEAEDAEAARQFMEADPAVSSGLMSATLHPYAVALQRRPMAE